MGCSSGHFACRCRSVFPRSCFDHLSRFEAIAAALMVDSVSPQLLRRLHASLQQVVSYISSFLQLTFAPKRAYLSARIKVFSEKKPPTFISVFIYENRLFTDGALVPNVYSCLNRQLVNMK